MSVRLSDRMFQIRMMRLFPKARSLLSGASGSERHKTNTKIRQGMPIFCGSTDRRGTR
jgi:hypothetical protein